jgi:hypothetical protein
MAVYGDSGGHRDSEQEVETVSIALGIERKLRLTFLRIQHFANK